MQFGWESESRKSIKESVKKDVYKRANRRCECCSLPLSRIHGDFHHWRTPTISPTAKTVQFLCPTCHRKYGHKRKVVRSNSFLDDDITYITIRKKVPKLKTIKPRKKTIKRKTTVKKKPTRKTTSKKKPPKRKTTTKRKVTKRKITKKKKPLKKRTVSKKTTRRKPIKRKKKTKR